MSARRKAGVLPEDSPDPRWPTGEAAGRCWGGNRRGERAWKGFGDRRPQLPENSLTVWSRQQTGSCERTSVMLAEIRKEESFNETFFNYFKENKIEIAHAITRLFPFLERLRDHSFITDKTYADSYEACRNLVPIENVVYSVLDQLEKLSGRSLLQALFNRVNLKAYPDLREIHKSLETELQDKYFPQNIKQEEQKFATLQPSYEQGPGDSCSQGSLTWSSSDPSSSDGSIQSGKRKKSSESTWDAKSKNTETSHSISHPYKSHQTNHECSKSDVSAQPCQPSTPSCPAARGPEAAATAMATVAANPEPDTGECQPATDTEPHPRAWAAMRVPKQRACPMPSLLSPRVAAAANTAMQGGKLQATAVSADLKPEWPCTTLSPSYHPALNPQQPQGVPAAQP